MRITRFWKNVKYAAGRVWAVLRRPFDALARRYPKATFLLAVFLLAEAAAVYLTILAVAIHPVAAVMVGSYLAGLFLGAILRLLTW